MISPFKLTLSQDSISFFYEGNGDKVAGHAYHVALQGPDTLQMLHIVEEVMLPS